MAYPILLLNFVVWQTGSHSLQHHTSRWAIRPIYHTSWLTYFLIKNYCSTPVQYTNKLESLILLAITAIYPHTNPGTNVIQYSNKMYIADVFTMSCMARNRYLQAVTPCLPHMTKCRSTGYANYSLFSWYKWPPPSLYYTTG